MRKKRERSLVKVIFEYDNGEAEYLDGKDLEKWKRASSGMTPESSIPRIDFILRII